MIYLSDSVCSHFASLLGCSNKARPSDYLGFPLGGSSRSKAFWDPVLDRCRKRLSRWKAHYFSFGSRITLIKATLSNLLIHYLSFFKIPKGVGIEIKGLDIQFLCRDQEASKLHLVNWKTVFSRKGNGGLALGGGNPSQKFALLGKWLWRYPIEQNALQAAVIQSKFRHTSNNWDANHTSSSYHRSP